MFFKGCGHLQNAHPLWLISYGEECALGGLTLICKALRGFFLCIFSSLTCLKKPVFIASKLTTGRYQPACHYFSKKNEKNPSSALCRKRTCVRPCYGPQAQISNRGNTEALLLLLYNKFGISFFRFSQSLNSFKLFLFFLNQTLEIDPHADKCYYVGVS